ncbi:MAG: importin-beta N-terminal domain-containing protein [Lacipirellulaceae bacterium]
MDTNSRTANSPNWLRWGQPVAEPESTRDENSSDGPSKNRLERIDSPLPAEDRNQLRDRLLKMIVSTEQARKTHSSPR